MACPFHRSVVVRRILVTLAAGAAFVLQGCEVDTNGPTIMPSPTPSPPPLCCAPSPTPSPGGLSPTPSSTPPPPSPPPTGGADTDNMNGFMKFTEDDLRDRIHGFWVGQLVGNFMGLPFEFRYYHDPMPILPAEYYNERSARNEGLNGQWDIPGQINSYQGAYTDDDTDIEFVTLFAVEKHGLDITYAQIAEAWKDHVRIRLNGKDALWFANRKALENMHAGLVPPATGSMANNEFWWTIDPQLVNEIWSVFYPAMIDKAVDKAEWGAKITSDSWGTHPTRWYGALYSGAFVTSDIDKLYDMATNYVPDGSPFKIGLHEVKAWYEANRGDWRNTRRLIYNKYKRYPSHLCGEDAWNCGVSAMINGLLGAMALLYGGGDFMQTVGIAIAAGYDNDNQAATLAGLLGTMHGMSGIPRAVTHEIAGNNWVEPFNNKYINDKRAGLPRDNTITGIVDKILKITQRAILENGGSTSTENGKIMYSVKISGTAGLTPNPPTPAPPPTPVPAFTYQRFSNKNAYAPFGAIDIDSDDEAPSGLSVQQCQDRCTADSTCDCVTRQQAGGKCWKRRNCDPHGWTSEWNQGYDVYLKNHR